MTSSSDCRFDFAVIMLMLMSCCAVANYYDHEDENRDEQFISQHRAIAKSNQI